MSTYFNHINPITYNPHAPVSELNYRFYDADKEVLGKTMAEHLRLAVCYWHNFCWAGADAFGVGTRHLPWQTSEPLACAYNKADAIFEFIEKLGVPFFTFHDIDAAPEGDNIKTFHYNLQKVTDYFAQKMSGTGIKLLWGTANLFSHPRYQAGAATNPNPAVFAYAATQVKHALEATHQLNGENYVLWGGREGYDTLLNTDLKKEKAHFGRFLSLVVEHKHKIGFKGQLLIEPKPCEPTKHQYDYDTETVYGFLLQHGLEKEFRVNIEANHATLAGHSFEHEVATALSLGCFGSIDANRGDPQNGWDTDQFPTSVEEMTMIIYRLLNAGGFTKGGFNFDAKVRRQSIDLDDMFYGHVGGIDVLAKSLLNAEKLIEDASLRRMLVKRYHDWGDSLGTEIMQNKHTLQSLSEHAYSIDSPAPISGRQEQLENVVGSLVYEAVKTKVPS